MSDLDTFRRKLEGTWQCISFTLTSLEDPTDVIHPWTEAVTGSLMYSSDGYMKAIICRPDLPRYTPSEINATPEQYQAVGAGLNAYTGRYSLGEKVGNEHIIYHHVEISVPPNWIGTTQTRYCKMSEEDDGRLQIVMRAAQTMTAEGEKAVRGVELKFLRKPLNNPDENSQKTDK